MQAVSYSTMRNNLKKYCDMATDNLETVIVTRKNDKNVVLMSLTRYNELSKIMNNLEYLNALDRGFAQIENGTCRPHELIEVTDDE